MFDRESAHTLCCSSRSVWQTESEIAAGPLGAHAPRPPIAWCRSLTRVLPRQTSSGRTCSAPTSQTSHPLGRPHHGAPRLVSDARGSAQQLSYRTPPATGGWPSTRRPPSVAPYRSRPGSEWADVDTRSAERPCRPQERPPRISVLRTQRSALLAGAPGRNRLLPPQRLASCRSGPSHATGVRASALLSWRTQAPLPKFRFPSKGGVAVRPSAWALLALNTPSLPAYSAKSAGSLLAAQVTGAHSCDCHARKHRPVKHMKAAQYAAGKDTIPAAGG